MSTALGAPHQHSLARNALAIAVAFGGLIACHAVLAPIAFSATGASGASAFDPTVSSLSIGTHRVAITWSVPALDPPLPLHVVAYSNGFIHEWPVQPFGPSISVVDSSVLYGTSVEYRVIAGTGSVKLVSAPTIASLPWLPIFSSAQKDARTLEVTLQPSPAADGYQLWRSIDGGALSHLCDLDQQTEPLRFLDGVPPAAGSITYQLRWHEADGVWRALSDTTVHLDRVAHPPFASFSLASANPSSEGVLLSYALPDSRSAELGVYDLTGQLKLSHTSSGTGTHSWSIARGKLAPGIYWVRFEHAGMSRTVRVVVLR